MPFSDPLTSRFWSAVTLDRSFVERIEQDPRVTRTVVAIVVAAGAGRGVTPGFEGGWIPVAGHGVAGLLIWLVCTGLIWNVAHRILGYSEGFAQLARVLGYTAAPLLGLWLNAIPSVGNWVWYTVGLHAVALVALVAATRAALVISLLRALGICALSLAVAILLLGILGLFLTGTPASDEIAASRHSMLALVAVGGEEDSWRSS
jgi:hypothetical protein